MERVSVGAILLALLLLQSTVASELVESDISDSKALELSDALCFLKLVPNAKRTKAEVETLSGTWQRLFAANFPAVRCKLIAVDRETMALQAAASAVKEDTKLRDFFLGLDGVHEVQVDTEVYRMPGQLPLEEVKKALAKKARETKRSRFFQFFRSKQRGIRGGGPKRPGPRRRSVGGSKKQEL